MVVEILVAWGPGYRVWILLSHIREDAAILEGQGVSKKNHSPMVHISVLYSVRIVECKKLRTRHLGLKRRWNEVVFRGDSLQIHPNGGDNDDDDTNNNSHFRPPPLLVYACGRKEKRRRRRQRRPSPD